MILLAIRLVWAFARLLLQLSWIAGTLAGHAALAIARRVHAKKQRERRVAQFADRRGG